MPLSSESRDQRLVGRLPLPTIHRVGTFEAVVKGTFWYQRYEKSGWTWP